MAIKLIGSKMNGKLQSNDDDDDIDGDLRSGSNKKNFQKEKQQFMEILILTN